MSFDIEKFGGRKFLLAIVAVGAGVYLQLNGQLSTEMTGLLLGLVTAFSVGNVASKRVSGTKISEEFPSPNSFRLDELEARVNGLEAAVSGLEAKGSQLVQAVQGNSAGLKQIADLLGKQ